MKKLFNKKGDLQWDYIAKIVIGLVVLVFVLLLIWKSKDKIMDLLDSFKDIMRFR